MKKLELAKATAPLAEYARDVEKEPVILTVRGRPMAALVAVHNADAETVSLSTNPRFIELIARSRTRQETDGGISTEEMRRRLGVPRTRRRKPKPR